MASEILAGHWPVLVLVAAAFAGSLIFGVTGFGAALLTIPVATHVVPLPFALALFVLMDLANALLVGTENPREARREEWVRLVPTIVLGTVVGVTLLVNLPRQAATLALGVFVVAFALRSLSSAPRARPVLARGWAYVAGFAGGVTSTLFGAGGPPYAMYLSQRGLGKAQYRATLGLAIVSSISLRAVAFVATGILLEARVWLYACAVVPAGLLGVWAARSVFHRISRETLMRVVALALVASGASLVWSARPWP